MSKNLYRISLLTCLVITTHTIPMPRVVPIAAYNENIQAKVDVLQGAVRVGSIALIQHWLGEGHDADIPGTDGITLLLTAAVCTQKRIAKFLLRVGANPDIQTRNGNTALHISAWQGDYKLVNLLLRNGADRTIRNSDGRTALDIANMQAASPPWDTRDRTTAEYLVSH